mmetsp:Transcript_18628/g.33333  ORF Transcript_18628/g.33333 Transcript_18628/m.33333 type:complete len:220 (-) Transcript_18628:523-1182(-)|eukprot:CAMPEP_0197520562 /NCGR_PEP_ID=MMETSP1318-20131121/5890_1 /TAXON_ID=552666 /ORGANISM="Partenskyella glossopodia, Strain RCC365" /LENGTH=219 /DNA_ID=CAMNT_0043072195 /DNA_START=93 /DNA_END=752 /DNA_ORIENTATION=-
MASMSNPNGRSNGINADGTLMNVGNKLGDKPSIRLWKDRLAGGSGDAMRQALTDNAMGLKYEEDGHMPQKPQLKARAKRQEAEMYKKQLEEKRKLEQKTTPTKPPAEKKTANVSVSSTNSTPKQDPFLQKRLMEAINLGLLKGIKICIEDGASASEPYPQSGYTALHYAAISGKTIVINYLLKVGANKNAKDTNGMTAYDLAVSRGKPVHVTESLDPKN